MPNVTNIGLLAQVKEILPQYVRAYLVNNVAGDPIYKVENINPQQFSDTGKSLICLYEYATDEFPQGANLCEESTVIAFRIAIRKMEKNGPDYETQIGWTRGIFAGQGTALNKFSGTYNGSVFTNSRLIDFGLFDFVTTPMQEAYSKNDTWHTFGVRCRVNFKIQIAA